METRHLSIKGIPAILWGPDSANLLIAVHGDQSHKADDVITILSEEAVCKGYQVLSFDLPEHGERKEMNRPCKVQNCIEDLRIAADYAYSHSNKVSLFGCSIGAYFSMLAYQNEPVRQSLFLSPVVDMKRIIDNIMMWFDVSIEQLETEQEIATPVKTLYWDYYQYVLNHPVKWDKPAALLYGAGDNLCELKYIQKFAAQTQARLTVMEEGEHFFHTEKQLSYLRGWLAKNIEPVTG